MAYSTPNSSRQGKPTSGLAPIRSLPVHNSLWRAVPSAEQPYGRTDFVHAQFGQSFTLRRPPIAMPYQSRPGRREVTSWTIHALSSGSVKEKKDP
jgi:hypothetical protein